MTYYILSCLVVVCIANCLSVPKSLGNRVTVQPLSSENHYEGDDQHHNPDYDHDAFLGKEEADEFDELPVEESKERLRELVHKIDLNSDGHVSKEEMKDWLRKVQNSYDSEEVEEKWRQMQLEEDDTLTWDQYEFQSYGSKETIETNEDKSIKEMIERDRLRWEGVDEDRDGRISKEQFIIFLHPENSKQTEHIYVKEVLSDMDLNKDGFVDEEEFIQDMDSENDEEEDEEQQNEEEKQTWIENERKNFKENLDENKDGKLDADEVSKWLLKEDWSQIDDECEHLYNEADHDKDGLLTEEEIIDNHDVFAGSQATDFGEILNQHDEF